MHLKASFKTSGIFKDLFGNPKDHQKRKQASKDFTGFALQITFKIQGM